MLFVGGAPILTTFLFPQKAETSLEKAHSLTIISYDTSPLTSIVKHICEAWDI